MTLMMPKALEVRTARVDYQGPDALKITRQRANPDGLAFAPSWDLLSPWPAQRKAARIALEAAVEYEDVRAIEDIEAGQIRLFDEYRERYLEEMRRSYANNRPAWERLLARPSVVLLCYCTHPLRCHRWIMRSVILPKLGAVDLGEID